MIRRVLLGALLAALAVPAIGGGAHSDVKVPEGLRVLVGFDKVVLLTTTWCGYCKSLNRDLQAAGVPYKEWDIEHSEVGRLARSRLPGGRSIPVSIVGESVYFGTNSKRVIAQAQKP